MPGITVYAGIATAALVVSLLIGAWRFGWTEWALVNKFAGWFVLLAYAGTGALTARDKEGLQLLLITFIAACGAIVALDFMLLALKNGGLRAVRPVVGEVFTGFAENRNAFAFQLLMVAAASCVLANRRIAVAGLALACGGLIYAGSRAGWGAFACLLAAALYMRALSLREALSAACSAAAVMALSFLPKLLRNFGLLPARPKPLGDFGVALIPEENSLTERIASFEGAIELFLEHPLFGAGLGSFMQKHIAESGIPLVIHSTPLWLMAELGLVGLLAFAVPALRIFGYEIKRAPDEGVAKLLVLILVAFGLMSLAHELLYQRGLWLLFGAALAYPVLAPAPARHAVSQ